MNVEIIVGSRAVWVNSESGCLGRFGRFGIDVHRSLEDQIAGRSECLFCTHARTVPADWQRFVEAMQKFHNVDLSHIPMPEWLNQRVS